MREYPFNRTDSGRAESKRPKQKNDCTVRALSNVLALDYDQAYEIVKERGRKSHGRAFFPAPRQNDEVQGSRFVWHSFPAVKGEPRMSLERFCEEYRVGRFIVRTAKHVFAVIDGVVWDTEPERPDRCVYGVWVVISA